MSSTTGVEPLSTVVTVTATADSPVAGNQTVDAIVSSSEGQFTEFDGELAAGTITIPDGTTSGATSVTVVEDGPFDTGEIAYVRLQSPSSGIQIGSFLRQRITLATPRSPVVLASLDANNGFSINESELADRNSASTANAGDVNGDGFDDLIIGVSRTNSDYGERAGASYVIFGTPEGIRSSITVDSLDGTNGFTFEGLAAFESVGAFVSAAGDLNGDGFDDVMIRAGTSRGDVFVVFGQAGAFDARLNANDLDGQNGFRITGPRISNLSDAGDVNGDGFDDLILTDRFSGNDESFVLFGKSSPFDPEIDLTSLDDNEVSRITGGEIYSVSGAGDINGDGFDDLLIESSEYVGYSYSRGDQISREAVVLFGRVGGFGLDINLTSVDETDGFRIEGLGIQRDPLGLSRAGDINGDGFDDFIIGTQRIDDVILNQTVFRDTGDAFVVFGDSESFGPSLDVTNLDGTTGFKVRGSINAEFATSVSGGGDINGDGFDDLIIGAPRENGSFLGSFYLDGGSGETYIIYGRSDAFPASMLRSDIDDPIGFAILGEQPNDKAGYSVSAAGDVNGDGFDDLMFNVRATDPDRADVMSYVIFGFNQHSADETQLGDDAANELTANQGPAELDILIGGRNNDTLISDGGPDVLRGGEGNDTLAIPDTDFSGTRRVEGGNGFDTLRLDGSGITLDLAAVPDNRLTGIEQIDISGTGDNSLTLGVQEVLNISDESNTLQIIKDAEDSVQIGSGWTLIGGELIDAESYDVFQQGAATLKVPGERPVVNLVGQNITVKENGASSTTLVLINVTTDIPVVGDQTIDVSVAGPGITPSDFTLSSTQIIIRDGTTSSFGTTFQARGDNIDEPDETATISISNPSAGLILGPDLTQEITITAADRVIELPGKGPTIVDLPVAGVYRLALNNENFEFTDDTGAFIARVELRDRPIIVNGSSGDDNLIVDFSNGNPIPSGGLTFNGGAQTTGDVLTFESADVTAVTHQFVNANDGSVEVTIGGSTAVIDYTGLEPIFDSLNAVDRTFNFGATDDDITVSTLGSGVSRIESTSSSETVGFVNPTGSLTVNSGEGDDTVDAMGSATAIIANGGRGSDSLVGTAFNDQINGGTGSDTLTGGLGDDMLDGGSFNIDFPNVLSESGDTNFTLSDDTLTSPLTGTDTLIALEAARLVGGAGANTINAANFSEPVTLIGGAGDDTITGAAESSIINGNGGNDLLIGGPSNDTIYAGSGNDIVNGNDGADRILGNGGIDTLSGNAGDDTLSGQGGNDLLQGGDGTDRIRESGNSDFTLSDTTAVSSVSGTDSLSSIEESSFTGGSSNNLLDASTFSGSVFFAGGGGRDTLRGALGSSRLNGNSGNDSLIGAASDDTIYGGGGNDAITGGAGNDRIFGHGGRDLILGDDGNDTIKGGSSSDTVSGGMGDDEINGDSGNDLLSGDDGNDLVDGHAGADTVSGNDGDDTVTGSFGSDTVFGNAGNDILSGSQLFNLGNANTRAAGGSVSDNDRVEGGDGNDQLFNRNGSQTMLGGAGSDTIRGVGGSDILSGDDGDDLIVVRGDFENSVVLGQTTISGGDGNDTIEGSIGDDQIAGGDGNDSIDGSEGDDTISGGLGNDQLIGNDGIDLLTESADTDFTLDDSSLTSPLAGSDTINGFERGAISGGSSANVIDASGFSGSVTLLGGARNDTLTGAAGSSIINGNGDRDVLSGGNSDDTIFGGSGDDTITGESGSDRLIGNSGRDTITTDPSDTVVGAAGDIII